MKCKKCGSELEKETVKFCPNCGEKIIDEKIESVEETKTIKMKNKVVFWDGIRYVIGGFFCLMSITDILNGIYRPEEFVGLLFGLSWFPFVYRKFISKIIKNFKTLRILQIVLPIVLFILTISLIPSDNTNSGGNTNNNPVIKNETAEEKALRVVKGKMYSSYQTLISADINSETGNYDFKFKESKNDLNAYTCASDLQSMAKQVVGVEKVGSIQFECSKNDQTFYYVSIDNLSSISANQVNENTKYYDSNHNEVNTNIDTLKANVVAEYKNSCSSYNYKDVLRNPSEYKGKDAYWFGEIVQVVDKTATYSVFRINVTCEKYKYIDGYSCDDTIYVLYYGTGSFIEDDMVKMWGTMDGTQTYTTVLGASVTIPKYNAKYMELQ